MGVLGRPWPEAMRHRAAVITDNDVADVCVSAAGTTPRQHARYVATSRRARVGVCGRNAKRSLALSWDGRRLIDARNDTSALPV